MTCSRRGTSSFTASTLLSAPTLGLLCLLLFLLFLHATSPARAYHADDGAWSILLDDVGGMDHVELLSGVLASESHDGEHTARVLLEEFRDVQHAAVEHDPAIGLRGVLRHLRHGETSAAAAA